MHKKLSIIIPFYNSEKTLSSCLESLRDILNNNCVEIILIDDNSTDNSFIIAKHFELRNKNIKLIHLDYNNGVSNARNIGLSLAVGRYILFLDSDDRLIKIHCLLRMLDNRNDIIVFGRMVYKSKYERCCVPYKGNVLLYDFINNNLSNFFNPTILMWVTNKLYLNEIIRNYDIKFNTKISFAEDMCFNLDYYKHIKNIYFIDNYFSIYNRNIENSLSRKNECKNISLMIDSFSKIKDFLRLFKKDKSEDFMIAQKNLIIYATKKVLYCEKIDKEQKYTELKYLFKYKKLLTKYLDKNDILENDILCYLKNKNFRFEV